MDEDAGVDTESSMPDADKLQAKHRREAKELRAKIQALKKGIPKGDKKRKKEVSTQVASLEQELEARHAAELAELQAQDQGGSPCGKPEEGSGASSGSGEGSGGGKGSMEGGTMVDEGLARTRLKEGAEEGGEISKKSRARAQKRKAKKVQQERERAQRIAEGEAAEAATLTPRQQERERLSSLLTPLGLAIRDITPDGHCLYAAVSDQLSVRMKIKVSVSELRSRCCDYIRAHGPDFFPYLTHPETGNQFTQEQFDEYCQEIAETAAWGGQLEILAFSNIFKVPINVYQANVPMMHIGKDYSESEPLNLSYHLHEFGLGEHYNSLVPTEQNSQ